jgi:putative ATP-binding cassette transporter
MFRLADHLLRTPDFPQAGIALMLSVAGVAGGALLPALNWAADRIAAREPDPRLFFIVLTLLILTVYAQRHAMLQVAQAAEAGLLQTRLRIVDELCGAPLRFLEASGAGALHADLAGDTSLVSQAALSLAALSRSAVAASVCLAYLGWLSPPGLLVALGFLGAYAFVYARFLYPDLAAKLRDSQPEETACSDRLRELLADVQEIKLDRRKREGAFHRYAWAASELDARKRGANRAVADGFAIGHAAFYLPLVALVMILPNFSAQAASDVFKLIAAAIFIAAELVPWLTWLPEIARADAVLERLERLENAVDKAGSPEARATVADFSRFEHLELAGAAFQYPQRPGCAAFSLGPIDLSLKRGEIVFVTGDNGEGKTTLLKLLTGLYPPSAGALRVDGRELAPGDVPAYRESFAAVFAAPHAFERLRGLSTIDPDALDRWLGRMGLKGKIAYAEGRFDASALSPGQRKRLALLAALLEDKPVYVLDEFAADQDPGFRERFYRELLPELKARGKTVIAATHDDRYFDAADRVLRMIDGRLEADAVGAGIHADEGAT